MKYKPGTFILVPNIDKLQGKSSELQTIYMWLCSYADKDGKCFPSRKTLAKQSGCGIRTVDKYLELLVEDGFITKQTRKSKNNNQNLSNTYTLLLLDETELSELSNFSDSASVTSVHELHDEIIEKNTGDSVEKGTVTISSNNYIHLTNSSEDKSSDPEVPLVKEKDLTELPERFGKNTIFRLYSLYLELWFYKYKVACKGIEIGRFGKAMKPLLVGYTEMQLAAIMYNYFHWHGPNGNDDREYTFVSTNGFTPEFMVKRVDLIAAYINNALNVNLSDIHDIRNYVSRSLKGLKK